MEINPDLGYILKLFQICLFNKIKEMNPTGDIIKVNVSKGTDVLIKAAAVAAAIVSLGAAYSFFINYFYVPKVEVVDVDFSVGTARIRILGLYPRIIEIKGETIYQISGDWGVRLGSSLIVGETKYNRIELVRRGMVVEYLQNPKS